LSILPAVRNGFSRSNPRQHIGEEPRASTVSPTHGRLVKLKAADAGRLRKIADG